MFLLVILAGKIEKLICNVTFEKIIRVNNEKWWVEVAKSEMW